MVTTEPPVNLCRVIEDAVRSDPGQPAVVCEGRSVSFGELEALSGRASARLAGDGSAAGTQVALVESSGIDMLVALLAAARLGSPAALVNPALGPAEVDWLVESIGGVAAMLVGAEAPDRLTGLAERRRAEGRSVRVSRLEDVAGAGPGGEASADGGDPGGAAVPPIVDAGTATALYLFTSGTTGRPKPVPVGHHAILQRVRTYGAGPQRSPRRAVRLMCVPMFHIGGLLGLLVNLGNGNTTVMQRRFDAGEWLALVEEHRVEASFVVPTMLHRILEHPDLGRRDLSSLRSLAYGAAAAPVDLVRRAMEALPHVGFVNTFGQTETLGGYTALEPGDHRDPARIGSVGRPLPGVEVRVVEIGTDRPLGPGHVGEVLVRSDQNVAKGWLRTGDLAHLDADGYLYPRGRLSDTINRGGEKFGPVEVEEVLRRHPAVAEVGVAGLPDPEMGERVGAVVVTAEGGSPGDELAGELRDLARRELAPFKAPERVVFADHLPYNELGKVSRAALVRMMTGAEGGASRPAAEQPEQA